MKLLRYTCILVISLAASHVAHAECYNTSVAGDFTYSYAQDDAEFNTNDTSNKSKTDGETCSVDLKLTGITSPTHWDEIGNLDIERTVSCPSGYTNTIVINAQRMKIFGKILLVQTFSYDMTGYSGTYGKQNLPTTISKGVLANGCESKLIGNITGSKITISDARPRESSRGYDTGLYSATIEAVSTAQISLNETYYSSSSKSIFDETLSEYLMSYDVTVE